MVNEKQTKRERNIRSKLMAAVAMLLVSSIMMVSTTYAWFTLSTAPEVTGITTSIAANGNLEIALSPVSGIGAEVGDANTSTVNWKDKNLTWGNLVDLGFAGNTYGLETLTLAPAQLAMNAVGTDDYTLADNTLAIPVYGADGRISGLDTKAYIAGKPDGSTGFSNKEGDYGVRAVGMASGLSAQGAKLRNATSAIGNYANAAIAAAANSLSLNGDALASMLIKHAMDMQNDTNNYAEHVDTLVQMTSDLSAAITAIDEALRASLSAAAAANIADETAFNTAIATIEGKDEVTGAYKNSLENLVTMVENVPGAFNEIMNARNNVATRISQAVDAAQALVGKTNVGWSKTDANEGGVNTVLNELMKIGADSDITVSGHSVDEIKANMTNADFLMNLANDCQIELGKGSGVYYDLAVITGNISAKVPQVPVSATLGSTNISTTLKNVIIKTKLVYVDQDENTVTVNPLLPTMKAVFSNMAPAGDEGGTEVVDAFYGYVIDMMVRTNAAESNLLLQTDPAQRVYNDSDSEATMGAGSTITFENVKEADRYIVVDMCRAIRVVLFDPSHENAVFGLAKVNTNVKISDPIVTGQDEEGKDINVYTITGTLELCEIVEGDVMGTTFIAGEAKTDTTLCALSQNIPQAISAMVYLEGSEVTSSDVLANENMVGKLNLQFASSAELKPMENSDLRNMGN